MYQQLVADFYWWVADSEELAPPTGDTMQPLLWGAAVLVSGAALTVLLRRRREVSMTERKTRSRLTGGIVAVIVLAVCLVVTTVALAYSMISVRDNTFATRRVRINLNDGEPGDPAPTSSCSSRAMTVKKDFFIENDSTGTVYYRLYFAGVSGDLADVLEVTVKDGNKTLYSGTPTQLENTQAADDLLAVGQRRTLTMYFHFPEATGNSAQAKDLTFTLCADATQTKNNPQRLFD